MKIEGSEGVYGVIVESRNITIWNKGTLKLGYNPESITLDTAISKPYVTIANANYNYAIANYGTIYMGGGTYVYDTRDTSSYTSDNTKKPIANCGTFNLYGGRTYYNFGVDSAFNNEVETAIVNIYQDEDSWWDVNRNGSTYTFNYYNAETSYTLNKYSYRKGKSKS